MDVGFEVFTAVTRKHGVSWDVMPFGSCKIIRIYQNKPRIQYI
jgi:hypothetical protein